MIDQLEVPIVQAPLAGGPSTPDLAAAVSNAGGLGFVAGGYRTADDLREDLARIRAKTQRPFGVNLFAPSGRPADPDEFRRYADRLRAEAERAGVSLGEPRFDDDGFEAKLSVLEAERPPVASFAFGCPEPGVLRRLQDGGTSVWVTVTGPAEAMQAAEAGADALVVQGFEAGGHRGAFSDHDGREEFGLLALLQLVRGRVDVPLVAAGGIATGAGIAAVLAAGAAAAALGSAFMLCPEAATSPAHRTALAGRNATGLTRAFTGRLARGIVNRLQAEHTDAAPVAYPELHHLTAPLRAHGRQAGDADVINLWAGQAHELARPIPAEQLVAELARDARAAAADLTLRLSGAGHAGST